MQKTCKYPEKILNFLIDVRILFSTLIFLNLFDFIVLFHFIPLHFASSRISHTICQLTVFMAMTLVIFILYGLFANMLRKRVVSSPKLVVLMQRSFAAVFAAFGIKLALTSR